MSTNNSSFVFKTAMVGVVGLLGVIGLVSSCERVEAANVGILVNLTGSDRGVQNMEIKSGYVFRNPFTQEVVEFPTAVQNVVWTKSTTEGSPNDESITFSSSEGVSLNVDISLSFKIDPLKAAEFYTKFRQTDLMLVAHGYVRNTVREAFNSMGSQMPVQEIYGSGKNKLLNKVLLECKDKLDKDGFVIEQITLNSEMRLPQGIIDSINNSIATTQRAIAAENKIREVVAEQNQKVELAKGEGESRKEAARLNAEAMILEAEGKKKAWLIEAEAQANYNKVVGATATPSLIQYKLSEKWNGALPQVSTTSGVITNFPK